MSGALAVLTPLLLPLAGAGLAAAASHPTLRRRLSAPALGWLLSLAPAGALLAVAVRLPGLADGAVWTLRAEWLPSLGMPAALRLDSLSALFALLVAGIGALVVIYAGYYFKGKDDSGRFQAYLLLFMAAMLGVVLAGDLISLFLFWEATSLTSFLLIGYHGGDPAARRGAFKSLFITAGGGVALLIGLLLLAATAGTTEFDLLLARGDVVRAAPAYPWILGLVALGAMTKSAQVPFHIWLPDAMSAPTPASAYLHSATMVKAGLYLMARLNPVLGFTDLWFLLLSLVGATTMLLGAYLGVKQHDLKRLLAYSTVSQLGVLMMLIGQDTPLAFKALAVGVFAHALYKSALFLIVGIVDHAAGTRDLRRLGGLWRAMPRTLAPAALAALSMAGLPPLFGFLAKETLLATVTHPGLPRLLDLALPAAAVAAGALILAQAGILLFDTFFGRPSEPLPHAPHDPPAGMLLGPALPALLSLTVAVIPLPAVGVLLAGAAGEAYGAPVAVSLALWTGINPPFLLSLVAISLGSILILRRHAVRALMLRLGDGLRLDAGYQALIAAIDVGARLATATQSGHLRRYLAVMLASAGGLLLLFGRLPPPDSLPALELGGVLDWLRLFTLMVSVAAAAATVLMRRDLLAIVALGASTLGLAILFALEPAPAVAMVQLVVDILIVVILVLALSRIPRAQRQRALELTFRQTRRGLLRDAVLAAGSGVVMSAVALRALTDRPRLSAVTPFFEAHAPAVGAHDLVSAILVDFRAFDTLIEITVFGVAGLGLYTLLRYATRTARDPEGQALPAAARRLSTAGIAGPRASSFLRALGYLSLPLSMVIAGSQILFAHDRPGDGFTAGALVSLAVGYWYTVFGYEETRRRLSWLRPSQLIGGGLLLALGAGAAALLAGGTFLAHVDFGKRLGLTPPAGIHLSSALVFDAAIFLTVLGGATLMMQTLGRPTDHDLESDQRLAAIDALEARGEVSLPEAEAGGVGR